MFSTIEDMRKRKNELEAIHGLEVTSRWLKEAASFNASIHDFTPANHMACAIDDVEDILNADVVVLFTIDGDTPTKRGGRHFESGFAYGRGRKLIVCGPRENIFHYLPDVTVCPTFEEVKQELLKIRYEQSRRRSPRSQQAMIQGRR